MKKIFKRLLAVIFASSAAYLVLLAYTQPLFAYELTAAGISVHSTQPIPEAMKATLERARARLDRSPLSGATHGAHVFICHSPWLSGLFARQNYRAGGVTDWLVGQHPLQFLRQCPRGRVARRGVLLQALQDDRFQVPRHAPIVPAEAVRFLCLHALHQLWRRDVVGGVVQRSQRQQLPERRPQAVHVAAAINSADRQDLLRAGDLESAQEALDAMDAIVDLLAEIDYPDGMTNGLRRTTDVSRSLVERSRADLTATVVQERLRRDLASS